MTDTKKKATKKPAAQSAKVAVKRRKNMTSYSIERDELGFYWQSWGGAHGRTPSFRSNTRYSRAAKAERALMDLLKAKVLKDRPIVDSIEPTRVRKGSRRV